MLVNVFYEYWNRQTTATDVSVHGVEWVRVKVTGVSDRKPCGGNYNDTVTKLGRSTDRHREDFQGWPSTKAKLTVRTDLRRKETQQLTIGVFWKSYRDIIGHLQPPKCGTKTVCNCRSLTRPQRSMEIVVYIKIGISMCTNTNSQQLLSTASAKVTSTSCQDYVCPAYASVWFVRALPVRFVATIVFSSPLPMLSHFNFFGCREKSFLANRIMLSYLAYNSFSVNGLDMHTIWRVRSGWNLR